MTVVDGTTTSADARPATAGARRSARKAKRRRPPGARLFRFDRALGARFVAGADEAGRGCLAGPLVAAAVLFDYERLTLRDLRSLSALNDSKQHTPEAREALYPRVLRAATRVAVTSRCVRGIDERGLHKTNLAALRDVLTRVGCPGCLCLSDGFPVGPTGFDQRPVVGGDATSAAIAAASVIAKVTRDRFMHADGGALPRLGVRRPRGLLHPGAPRRHRAPGRVAAAPHVLPVDGVPAAGPVALVPRRRSRIRRVTRRGSATVRQ